MTELEKVEKGMECCTNDVSDPYACQECPYLGHKPTRDGCIKPMLIDALAILRKHEPVKAKILKQGMTINYRKFVFAGLCPACNSLLLRQWVACPNCGKKVKWDE